jgi:hypothetical protein
MFVQPTRAWRHGSTGSRGLRPGRCREPSAGAAAALLLTLTPSSTERPSPQVRIISPLKEPIAATIVQQKSDVYVSMVIIKREQTCRGSSSPRNWSDKGVIANHKAVCHFILEAE